MKKFFYRVEKGDSLISIASRFNASVGLLIKQNALRREVEEGDLLYVKTEDKPLYAVTIYDTAESLAEKFNTTPQKILEDNGVDYLFYGLKIKI